MRTVVNKAIKFGRLIISKGCHGGTCPPEQMWDRQWCHDVAGDIGTHRDSSIDRVDDRRDGRVRKANTYIGVVIARSLDNVGHIRGDIIDGVRYSGKDRCNGMTGEAG